MKRLDEWIDRWATAIRDAARKHNGSMIHTSALISLSARLQKVRTAVSKGDIEKAVLWAADFVDATHKWENLFQKPKILQEARRENAIKAANKRHAKPLPLDKAMKKEFEARQQAHPDEKPTTIYKAMAGEYLGDKKHWRRVRTRVEK